MEVEKKVKINDTWRKVLNRNRTCMYSNCSDQAIKSHVLQKNGILKQISKDNHLIELKPGNAFDIKEKGMHDFKKVGINEVYTFKGFCKMHDTEIFKQIENYTELDLMNPMNQALFSYRGLCQEIRRKEISYELIKIMMNDFPFYMKGDIEATSDGFLIGIKNLNFFKQKFELALKSNDFKEFYFSTVKIPKIELCISTVLNVGELVIPEDTTYKEWKDDLNDTPDSTSFINIFPYKENSYFIAGYHKDYPCKWTDKKINKFTHSKPRVIKKELSDLIVFRVEFWAMSPKLFSNISPQVLKKYKKIFNKNLFNHSGKMRTKINLFKGI